MEMRAFHVLVMSKTYVFDINMSDDITTFYN